MATPGRISKGITWKLLYVITGVADAAQALISLTGVGVLVSEIIEGAMPFIIIALLKLKGITLFTRPTRLISLVGASALGFVSGGIAPLWILDVWYIHSDVKREDAEYLAQQQQNEQLSNITNQPMNEDGVRPPRAYQQGTGTTETSSSGGNARIINLPPLVQNGVRAPSRPMYRDRGNIQPKPEKRRDTSSQEVAISE